MKTRIALFRGINVGGNNIIAMKTLSALLEANGYQDVKTYIQSGNVVFKASISNANNMSALISNEFGFIPKVLLLDIEAFQQASLNCPFMVVDGQEPEGKAVHFYFLGSIPTNNDQMHQRLEELCGDSEQYQLIDSVFYLYAPNGIGRSKLASKVETVLGVDATARNLNTVRKILSML